MRLVDDDASAMVFSTLSLALSSEVNNDDERLEACGLLKIEVNWVVSNEDTSVVLRVFNVFAGMMPNAEVEIEFNKVGDMLLAKSVALIPAFKTKIN